MSDVRPKIDEELQMCSVEELYTPAIPVYEEAVSSLPVDDGVAPDQSFPASFNPLAAPSGPHKFPILESNVDQYAETPQIQGVAPARPSLVSILFHPVTDIVARVEGVLKKAYAPVEGSSPKLHAAAKSTQPHVDLHDREQEQLNRWVLAEVQGGDCYAGPMTEWQKAHFAEALATARAATQLSSWWTEKAMPVVSQVAQSLGVGSLFAETVAEKAQKQKSKPRVQHVEVAPSDFVASTAPQLEVVQAEIVVPLAPVVEAPPAVIVLDSAKLTEVPAQVTVAPEAIVAESHAASAEAPVAVATQVQTGIPAVASGDSESESVAGFSGSLETAQTASDAELPLVQVAAVQTMGVAEAGVNISSNLNVSNGSGNGRQVSPEISAPVVSQVSDSGLPHVVTVASGNQNTVKTRGSASNEVLISSSVSTRRPAQVVQAQRSYDSSAQAPVVVHLQSGTSIADAQGYQNARTVDPQKMAAQVSVSQMAAVEHSHGDIVASDSNSSRLAGKLAQTLNTVAAGQDSSKGGNSGDDRGRDRNQENAIAMKDDIGELSQPEWVDDEGYAASFKDVSATKASVYVTA